MAGAACGVEGAAEQDAVTNVLLSLSAVKSSVLAGTGCEVLLVPDKTLLPCDPVTRLWCVTL